MASTDELDKAVQIIKSGGIVAFPTETVYGLGANAYCEEACLKIFEAKGRPANNPLIVHVATLKQAKEIAIFNERAYALSKLLPGPLTIVLPLKSGNRIAKCVTAGLDTIAVRVPAHPLAYKLILRSGVPIAAPSANKSGYLSSTLYEHVKDNFKSSEVFIVGYKEATKYGLESTIVDLSTSTPTILRFGFITPDLIEQILGEKVAIAKRSSKIKAPGMLYTHYAPKTPIRINATSLLEDEVGLNFGNSKLESKGSLNLSPRGNLTEGAANLFAYLHKLDKYALENALKRIAITPIPDEYIGLAINDRLERATSSS